MTTVSRLAELLRQALRGEAADHTRLPIRHSIILLAIPMMLEMAMESVFALVDTYFVGRLGVEALTTIGLTEVMLTLIYSLAVGLSIAPTAMVARFTGEGRPDMANRAATQSILLAIAIGLIIGVAGWIYAEDLLRLMGGSEAVVVAGAGYTRIMFGTNVVIMLLFVINGVFRGAGDAARAMRVLWVANGINILLDPLFIFGWGPLPGFGVEGAAIATSIGRGCGVLLQLYYLLGGRSSVRPGRAAWMLDLGLQRRIIRIASTGAVQNMVASASWIVLMRIVAAFGTAAVAGYTVAVRLILFTLLPAWGLSNAAATFVGQNLGAGSPERAERGVWVTLSLTCVYLLILSLGYYFLATPLVSVFADNEEALIYGVGALEVFGIGYLLFGLGLIPVQAFNGAGDTRTPMLMNILCFWIIEIPLGYYFARSLGWGVPGVVWAIVVAEAVLAGLALYLFKRGGWKTTRV